MLNLHKRIMRTFSFCHFSLSISSSIDAFGLVCSLRVREFSFFQQKIWMKDLEVAKHASPRLEKRSLGKTWIKICFDFFFPLSSFAFYVVIKCFLSKSFKACFSPPSGLANDILVIIIEQYKRVMRRQQQRQHSEKLFMQMIISVGLLKIL